jgi:hypothetical protein
MNETKERRDFAFRLTKKQAVTFDVATGDAGPNGFLATFPTTVGDFPFITPGVPASPFRGELICFAVNPAGSAQESHNHLSGTATVGISAPLLGGESASVPVFTYEYNSWNFVARGVAAGQAVGTPGRLDLTGANGAYDACPAYNLVHFSPTTVLAPGTPGDPTTTPPTPATPPTLLDHRISVSSCLQDLRQDFTPHWTKLQFDVWNAFENKFTGAFECANSSHSFPLSGVDVMADNFAADDLRTDAAFAHIRGVASTQCNTPRPTEATGLVAVIARVISLGVPGGTVEIPLHGTTANHAGVSPVAGFILWDPQDGQVPEGPSR